MKKTITLIAILLNFVDVQAQAPAIQWQKAFGGSMDDVAESIKVTPDGGYIVAGRSNSTDGDITGNHGGNDYWVVKFDATGAIQWQKSLGGSGDDIATDIQTTTDGGYIVAGRSSSTNGDVTGNHGNSDYWIVKLDSTGVIQWQKCFGGSAGESAEFIQVTSDGGYIVTGRSFSHDGDLTFESIGGYWIVKMDSGGTKQWQKSFGGGSDDTAQSIRSTPDGGYIVIGSSTSTNGDVTGNHGVADYWVVKMDSAGVKQWQKSLGGSNYDYAFDIQNTSDGGYILAGYSSSNNGDVTGNHGAQDFWIVKINNTGTLQWQKSLGGSSNEQAYSIQVTSDGGYVVGGYSRSNSGNVSGNHGGSYDFWLIRLDAVGVVLWQKSLGGNVGDYGYDIQITPDGGYIMTGYTLSNDGEVTENHGLSDFWVVKLGPDLSTTIFEKSTMVVYPNPVLDLLQIQTSNNATVTKIRIVDINGRIVIEQPQDSTSINVKNLPQGIYFLEAYSGEDKFTTKFVKD